MENEYDVIYTINKNANDNIIINVKLKVFGQEINNSQVINKSLTSKEITKKMCEGINLIKNNPATKNLKINILIYKSISNEIQEEIISLLKKENIHFEIIND